MSSGKWDKSMDMCPRELPWSSAPVLPTKGDSFEPSDTLSRQLKNDPVLTWKACNFSDSDGEYRRIEMLGHSGQSIELSKGSSLIYHFQLNEAIESPKLITAMIPTQPNDGGRLRYSISIDGGEPVEFDLKEQFRSEQWKLNVLRGQARRDLLLPTLPPGSHTVVLKALDNHIVADQLMIDSCTDRKFYLIPGCFE
ncbi:MAG: hypothetical protein NC339_06560 [Muribaculaceae bacterium]|nr:hypothetical protein [Muribaculaceae bacterium]